MSEKDNKLEQFKKEANTLVDQSKDLMIIQGNQRFILKDENEREMAGILLKEAHELEKKIKAHYKPIEDAHRETGRQIKKAKTEQLSGPVEAKRILSQGIGEYEAKIRREAEEKARIERERIEAERLAEAERKQKEADALKETGKPEDMVEAVNLETEVEEILDAPPPVVQVKQPEKIAGIKQRRYVKCDVVDERTLRLAIIEKLRAGQFTKDGLLELLKVNDSSMRAYAKSLEAGGMPIEKIHELFPGIHVYIDNKAIT